MFKKIILSSVIFVFSVCVCLCVNAATDISIKDFEEDIVNITGSAASDTVPVSLVVLNPGYTDQDFVYFDYEAQTAAIQYVKVAYASQGIYSFDVPMTINTDENPDGGVYTFIVTVGTVRQTPISYEYYFNDSKLSAIALLNADGGVTVDNVRNAYEKFSLSEFDLYKHGDIAKITTILEVVKEEQPTHIFTAETDAFDKILKNAALLSAYNTSSEELLVDDDDFIKYPELIGLEDTQEWFDYKNDLKNSGRSVLNDKLISGTYSDIESVSEGLREFMAYYGLMAYKSTGFGHFDRYFENYADIYSSYDFKLNKINSSNRNKVYKALLSSDADNLDELADDFNELVKSGGSDGSGGGSGFSTGSSDENVSLIPPFIPTKAEFHDIGGVAWANEAIMVLTEKDVINGKAKNVFAPNDNVTRAEFIKMLISALEIKSNNVECTFADVAEDWSKPYIVIAVGAGIANGVTEDAFNPTGVITREMGATFCARALQSKGVTLTADGNIFTDDYAISEYAKESVYGLKNAGVVSGMGDNSYNPLGNMTRAQAAKMIYELLIFSEGAF